MAKRMADSNAWVRTFEVTEPTKHRKGFTVYKVTSVVFPRSFPESATKITIWKRYSDFRKLHKDLEIIFKQLYLKGEFPIFPKAKVFGRFEHEVVEERRKAALVLLQFTANYTQLFTSKPFMLFFENGYSSQDFIGKILFSKGNTHEEQDPPSTVLQEKSEICAPCLKPDVLWNSTESPSNEADCVSLSPSSISSSISPTEASEMSLPLTNEPVPCSSTSRTNDLVENKVNGEGGISALNGTVSSTKAHDLPSTSIIHSSQGQERGTETPDSLKTTQRQNGIVRSSTVTDDLSSYFDEEFEDAAFLFPTGSCSSLNTLPGFTPSSDIVESVQKDKPSSSRGLFTLTRKKSNGFGLFDFLPLFPKKSKKKSAEKEEEKKPTEEVTVEKIKKTSLSVGYICEAAGHFAVAQFHESNSDYQNAFSAYKEGIRVLLAGAQDDTDRERKLLAKNKLEKYLCRAESMKDSFLTPGMSTCGNGAISPVFSSPNKKAKSIAALDRYGKTTCHQNGKSYLCSLEELRIYKVVGIGPSGSKILVVMNPVETSPKCYATKVLWKSPCVIYPEKPTVIPCHVPFMVKLLKWFDSTDKIILLLEYAGGGRLEDFVKNYQSKRLSLSTPPEELSPTEELRIASADFIDERQTVLPINREINPTSQGTRNDVPVSPVESSNDNQMLGCEEEQSLNLQADSNVRSENGIDNELSSENEVFSTPAPTPPPESKELNENPDVMDVSKLLENSKALLQTVTKTLEEGSSPRRIPKCNIPVVDTKKTEDTMNEKQNETCKSQVSDSKVVVKDKGNNRPVVESSLYKESDADDDAENACISKRMVPEGVIRVWAAEIVIALEALHGLGITYGDLHVNDILLGENGHVLLRYKSLWTEVDDPIVWNPYVAPEVRDSIGMPLWKVHSSADWWSFGAILFLLLTGQSLHAAHPEGIYPEMIFKVPDTSVCETAISRSAQTLLKELLHYSPELRLGYYGAPEIKTHPFFEGFDWEKATEECRNEAENYNRGTTPNVAVDVKL